jgi:hypothetical protein
MIQLHTRLVTPCKGDQSADVYYNKMKGFEDEMASTVKPREDEEFISYVPVGLDHDYNSFVENVTRKTENSLGSLYSKFLAAEARLELQNSQCQFAINAAARGCGSFCGRGGGCHRDDRRGSFSCDFRGRNETRSSSGTKLVC